MIYVRLFGGLGNQMFQYATARRLAIARGTEVVMDLSHLNNQPDAEVPRQYELHFLHPVGKIINQPAEKYRPFPYYKRVKLLVINEVSLGFDPNILILPDNVLLVGQWQCYKYFEDVSSQIRQDFNFRPLSASKQKIANKIKSVEYPVALQVRRGDMAHHPVSSKYHGLVPLNYYHRAIELVIKELKTPHFFVVSDDPKWCRDNLKVDYPVTFVDHIPGTGHEDMQLISLCRHQIIANSSFGWWGAWLNDYEQKIVVSPKKWFQQAPTFPKDRFPKSWITL